MEIIDDSIRKNRIYRLQSELTALQNAEPTTKILASIEEINKILADIEEHRKIRNADTLDLKDHKRKMKEAVYKARWHTLTIDQRTNRLNEYLERALVMDETIIDRLREMVKTNELKSRDVEYRIDLGKIISIKILEAENGKFVLNDPKKAKSKSRSKTRSKSNAKATKAKANGSKANTAKVTKTVKTKATKTAAKGKKKASESKSRSSRTKSKPKTKAKAKARVTRARRRSD